MIGGLIKIAAQMGAWSASVHATAGAAKWVGSRMRRAVGNYTKYAAANKSRVTKFTRATVAAVSGKRELSQQGEWLLNNVDRMKDAVRRSQSNALRRFNKAGAKNATLLGKAVRDEIYAMPMNYTMYRIDKHRAVTPEEREATTSFRKYYLGTPMMMSVATGFAFERMQNAQYLRHASGKIAKRLGAGKRKKIGKFTMSAIGAAKNITDRMAAMRRARLKATEGRTILSTLGSLGPMEMASRVWRTYRKESTQIAGGGGPSNMVKKILADHEHLTQTYKQRAKSMRAQGHEESSVKAFEDSTMAQVKRITDERLNAYSKKATSGNKFIQYFERISEELNDPTVKMRNEFMTISKDLSPDFAGRSVPTGRYLMGEGKGATSIDFGRVSLTNIKAAAVSGATKGSFGKFLHLFGMKNVLQSRDAEHALIGAVTVTKREPLNLPMAYFDESGKASSEDIMAQMMGHLDLIDAEKKGFGDDVRTFLDTRLKAMAKEYDIDPKNTAELNEAFKRSARHGELWFDSGDLLVQKPGGEAEIITHTMKHIEGLDGKVMQPVRVQIGGYLGETLQFTKFTRESDSIPAKLIRSHTGYEEATYRSNRGETRVVHGPGKYGKVMDAITSEDQQGLWYKFKNLLDLGYSQETSVFTKISSIFRKHTDPRYPTTFFSRDYVRSPEFRQEVVRTGRSKEDMVEFFRDEADRATMEYWYGGVRRAGGTEEMIKLVQKGAGKDPIMGSFTANMITPNMSVGQAKERADALIENLEAHAKETAGDVANITKHFLHRDIDDLKAIRRMFNTPDDKTVLDVMGHISSRNKTVYGARPASPNKMDEYNALVLRIQSGLYQSGDIDPHVSQMTKTVRNMGAAPKVLTDKERSAWYASSHLSRTYHGLASRVAEATVEFDEAALQGIEGHIESIIARVGTVDSLAYKDITQYYNKRWRFAPWSVWDYDHRLKWGDTQNVKTGIYLLPKASTFGLVSKKSPIIEGDQTIQIAEGVMDAANISVMSLFHAFNRAASEMLGIGFDETNLSTPMQYFEKMLTQRVIPFTAMYMGYSVLDRTADQFLDGTPFGEGLTTFGANILAGARVGAQGFLDTVGATGMSQYMEDLMPGIITSPGSGLARGLGPIALGMSLGMKTMGPQGALTGGIIGSAVGMLTGGLPLGVFGMWDISKERKEVVQELLGEKEVAVRKGRWWELSGSPFEGTRIQYFRPHIYNLLRSDYKEAPGFKDSLFTEMVGHLAPDMYAMKNYYSRPYPVTSGLFSNLPVFGNMMDLMTSAVPFTRPTTLRGFRMHEGEFSPTYMQRLGEEAGYTPQEVAQSYVQREGFFSTTAGSSGHSPMGNLADSYMRSNPIQPGTLYNYTEMPMMRSSMEWGLGETTENIKDIVGLRGFIMGSAFESLSGRKGLFDYAPELAAPADIPGIQREYWDYELGGILGMSEIIRRYIPHRRNQIEMFNPIRNTMPTWLPGYDYYIDLQHGDPYTQVRMGEARLPGAGYEALHDVSMTMPIVADILGEETESQAAYFLGLPEEMSLRNREMDIAKTIAISYIEDARRYGELLDDNKVVHNAQHNVTATADAIIRTAQGKTMPVKVVPKGFGGESNLNAFLVMAGVPQGMLLEVNTETGGITERMVKRDMDRFASDLKRAGKAQAAAYGQIAELEREGRAINLANSYSWFDRFKILADVAQYSEEFKIAKNIVLKQINAGLLPAERVAEFEMIKEQVERKRKAFEFSEYRFKDLGEGLTPYTKARDREVKAQYNILERTMGEVWERFSHLRNPLQVKFYSNMDALEQYERNAIYGKTIKMWENPVEDYLKSYAYTAMGEEDPMQGALSWATGGFLMGGAPLAGLGAGVGAALSGINWLTDGTFIPDRTLDVREVVAQADSVKYIKYRKLYEETGNPDYLAKANRTVTGKGVDGKVLQTRRLGPSLGRPERDYIEDIVNNVTEANIGRVSQLVPDPALASIYKTIGYRDHAQGIMREYSERQMAREIPGLDSSVYSANVPIETPIISTFEQEGLNAHDAGYGWYSQMAQLERLKSSKVFQGESLYDGFKSNVTVRDATQSLTSTNKLRRALSSFGTNVQIVNDGQDRVEVEIISRGL